MPAFLNSNNLQPFISNELRWVLNKIDYIDKNDKAGSGFDANILPLLCKVYLDARAERTEVAENTRVIYFHFNPSCINWHIV
jgi:hypothetical protein